MILVVASTKDVASLNIRDQLLTHYDFKESTEVFHSNPVYFRAFGNDVVKLVTIREEAIYYQNITCHFNPQLIVFVSRHASKSGTPTLSVHAPGNLAEAHKGGISKRVSIAPANAMKEALQEMEQQKAELSLNHQVSYECTHHGPSLDLPAMFVELGSTNAQWKDVKAAEAIAHATIKAVSSRSVGSNAAVGIGGPHYNRKFTDLALQGPPAFGHIISKHAIPQITEEILIQCVERTVERVETVFLDWKGVRGSDKPKLMEALEKAGLGFQKV